MISSVSRSTGVLSVFRALIKSGKVSESEVAALVGDEREAIVLRELLVKLKFVKAEGNVLLACPKLDCGALLEDFDSLEDYVFGEAEAKNMRRVRGLLSGVVESLDGTHGGSAAKKKEVDPQTVKKYAKGFIDVSEIVDEQKRKGLTR